MRQTVSLVIAVLVAVAAHAQDTTRSCKPALEPSPLPPLDHILDSAGVLRALSVRDSAAPLHLHAVLTLQFDRLGGMKRLAVLDRDVGADTAMALGRLLASYVRLQAPEALPWGVRIRARLAPEPTMTLERSILCGAIPDPHARARGASIRSEILYGNAWIPIGTDVTMRALVSDSGVVIMAETGHNTMSPQFAEIITENAKRTAYKPALLDGFPTTAWVEYRVRLRESRDARRP